jgi:hypothetical protein
MRKKLNITKYHHECMCFVDVHELKKSLMSILSLFGSISNGIILRIMLVSHMLFLNTLKPSNIMENRANVSKDTNIM